MHGWNDDCESKLIIEPTNEAIHNIIMTPIVDFTERLWALAIVRVVGLK